MPENNLTATPATDAQIAELEALHAAATPGNWAVCLGSVTIEENFRIVEELGQFGGPSRIDNALACAFLHNAFPGLLARLREAEREREELRERVATSERASKAAVIVAARAQEACRFMMSGLPLTGTVEAAYQCAESAGKWLSARDVRQKKLGAAEWLENNAMYPMSPEEMLEAAAQLRREGE